MRIEHKTWGLIESKKMRIQFGIILSILMRPRNDENTVWTDSQLDYRGTCKTWRVACPYDTAAG